MTKNFNDNQNSNVNINRLQAQLQTATNTLVKAQEAVGTLALQEKREDAWYNRLYEVADALCSECLHLQELYYDEDSGPIDYKKELERAWDYVDTAYHDVAEIELAMSITDYPIREYSCCQRVDQKWCEIDKEDQSKTTDSVNELEAEKKRSNMLYNALIQMAKQCSSIKKKLDELYHYGVGEDLMDNTIACGLDEVDDVLADIIRDANGINSIIEADSKEVLTQWKDASDRN